VVKVEPNGHLLFKTALGTETEVPVCVKISGNVCVWIGQFIDGDGTPKVYLPSQGHIKEASWYEELVRKYGECQGIMQDINKVVVPGEPEPDGKPNW
jgi:hypothetical protein